MRGWALVVVALGCAPHAGPTPTASLAPPTPRLDAPRPKEQPSLLFAYTAHPERDADVAREYDRIDAELRDSFDFDSAKQVWVWGAPQPQQPRLIAPANGEPFARRLSALLARQPSPEWVVIILARRASIYESIWLGIDAAGPLYDTFTPQQRARLAAMRASGRGDLIELADAIERRVTIPAFADRDEKMENAARSAIASYAWASAVAYEMHALDLLADIRERLRVFETKTTRFASYVYAAPPPIGIGAPEAHLTMKEVLP